MLKNGRFPPNTLPPLYQNSRRFDLSESTTKDLRLGELIDLLGLDAVRDISLGYTDPTEGWLPLREAIGQRWGVPADRVVTTHGAAFALYLVAAELDVGKAIITAPYFQQAYNTLAAHGWEVCVVQNRFDDGFRLNLAGICDNLDSQTRLVSIASPQNPSGVSIPVATIRELLTMMAEKAPAAYLLVDETYREAAYESQAVLPSVAALSPRLITCSSVSKAYGAPDLRVGWLTLPNEALRQRMIRAKQNIVICDSGLTEQLATVLLNNAPAILQKQRRHMTAALGRVRAWQASQAQRLEWVPPDAGALCCMRLSPERYGEADLAEFWRRLAANETFVRPGLLFGSNGRYFRLGFGHVTDEQLAKGLENIAAALDF